MIFSRNKKIISHVMMLCFLSVVGFSVKANAYQANEKTYKSTVDDSRYKQLIYKKYKKRSKPTKPVGYNKMFVYVADGLYDITQPNADPNLSGCAFTPLCDGDYFQRVIMGRDDYAIQQKEYEAKAFYFDRFGIDVDDPATSEKINFRMIQVDPRLNYHAVFSSAVNVPNKGWRVRDGGWVVVVTDPDGLVLGGDFDGEHVPVGTLFVFGEYNLKVSKKGKHSKNNNIVISYRALTPQRPDDKSFMCELYSKRYGEGLVKGRVESILREDGLIKMNVVSVLTFPGLSDLPILE